MTAVNDTVTFVDMHGRSHTALVVAVYEDDANRLDIRLPGRLTLPGVLRSATPATFRWTPIEPEPPTGETP